MVNFALGNQCFRLPKGQVQKNAASALAIYKKKKNISTVGPMLNCSSIYVSWELTSIGIDIEAVYLGLSYPYLITTFPSPQHWHWLPSVTECVRLSFFLLFMSVSFSSFFCFLFFLTAAHHIRFNFFLSK